MHHTTTRTACGAVPGPRCAVPRKIWSRAQGHSPKCHKERQPRSWNGTTGLARRGALTSSPNDDEEYNVNTKKLWKNEVSQNQMILVMN